MGKNLKTMTISIIESNDCHINDCDTFFMESEECDDDQGFIDDEMDHMEQDTHKEARHLMFLGSLGSYLWNFSKQNSQGKHTCLSSSQLRMVGMTGPNFSSMVKSIPMPGKGVRMSEKRIHPSVW